MSECMTLADDTIEQKDTCKEIDAKDIVEFILEEVLISAVIFSDKGCNRIGDFNITEDFCQQFDEIAANSKNFEVDKLKSERDLVNKDLNLNSGETVDRFASLVTAKENLEFILDSLPKRDDKVKSVNECKIITEEALADNELRIENGQIHIERNRSHNVISSFPERVRREFYEKKDVIKDEKIEIEYFNDGKLNKIYVPLSKAPSCDQGSKEEQVGSHETPRNDGHNAEESTQRPFAPFSTEELRQVWENANSSIVGGWNGDMSTQPEEVARIMEELSSVQVLSNPSADPNRPRTCEFGEENVKKMTKEIEEINFNQSHNTLEDIDPGCHPDGQGDADLDAKSFVARSKEGIKESSKAHKDQEDSSLCEDLKPTLRMTQSRDDVENSSSNDRKTEEVLLSSQVYANLNKTEDEGNEEKLEGAGKSVETLIKSPSPKANAEEYLIESESSSDRSILINQFENEKSVAPSNSDNLNVSLESEKEIEDEKMDKERSLGNSEEIVQSTLDGGSLEEKDDEATANRLNSEEEVDEKGKRLEGVESKASSLGTCTLRHYSAQPQESDMSLRKCHKTSDLSLRSSKLYAESNSSRKVFDELSSSHLAVYSNKSVRSAKESCDYGRGANPLHRDSKTVTDKTSQDKAASPNTEDELPKTETPARVESRNEKIFEKELEMDSFTGGREIPVPYSDAHLPTRMGREMSDLEIFTTKSENYSPSADFSGERLIDDFEDIVNRYNIHTVPKTYLEEESQHFKESKNNEEEEEDKNRTDEVSLNSTELQTEYLTNQEENDDVSNITVSLENTTNNESSSSTSQKTFKLHSQKMYLGSGLEPTRFEGNKFVLTNSQEAFIDSTENVIQVIDPHENSNDEDSGTISFSLLNESSDGRRPLPPKTDRVNNSDSSVSSNNERTLSQNENILKRNVFSGMTTIGPMKNLDVDPKDLTGPEIDFGKMTRISSSRQLTSKDIFPTDIKSESSGKIFEEHDSEGESSVTMEGERLEMGSLINRDIASLTKVQKVKEVMSYHPRADEDFEDDDTLTRPRLDLKDVESMTDERFKMPDVNIPLLSFEMANSTSEADKEYLQGMQLVLSGNCFSNNPYYEEDFDEDNVQTCRNRSVAERNSSEVKKLQDVEKSEFLLIEETRNKFENSIDDGNEKSESCSLSPELSPAMNDNQEQADQARDNDSPNDSSTSHPKYGTLGSVFKKASSKIIRKEGDLFLRNSKSLPRDASNITTSESIRSILEDCHSSATNVLKKSRSLLKSTQSIFKTMSQSRFGVQSSSTNLNKQRMTSSDTEASAESTLERKTSTFQWKEDLSKVKTSIKNKVGKTFKTLDRGSSVESDPEILSENKDLRLAVRNEENYRVDRMENFRKLLPKSPLTYKSQFVRSQMSIQSNVRDDFSSASESGSPQRNAKKDSKSLLTEGSKGKTEKGNSGSQKNEGVLKVSEKGFEPSSEDKTRENDLTSTGEQTGVEEGIQNQAGEQPEYIVMETIQGLPTVDSENYSYETEQKDETSAKTDLFEQTKENENGSERYRTEVSDYSQHTPTVCSPFESDTEEDKDVGTSPSEKKIGAKNKKFSARFRSFWSSAFGKVKTSPKNKDPS